MDISKKFGFFLFWAFSCLFVLGDKYWVDGTLIKVNESRVTLREFYLAFEELKKEYPNESKESLKKAALDSILQELLILERAKEMGVEVSKEEIKKAFNILAEKNNMPDGETFLKAAEEAGISREVMEEKIKKEIIVEKVLGSEVLPAHDITEVELREHYEKIKEKFKEKEKFYLKEIVLINPKTIENKIKLVEAGLKEGKNFEELARLYSEVPSKDKGGDIGEVLIEDLAEEIKEGLSDLKEGEISKPIYTKFGVHFILLVKKIPEKYKPFESVKEEVREDFRRTKYEEKVKEYVEGLKNRYLIQIYEELLEEPK